jgi:hypothetical protein
MPEMEGLWIFSSASNTSRISRGYVRRYNTTRASNVVVYPHRRHRGDSTTGRAHDATTQAAPARSPWRSIRIRPSGNLSFTW